MERPGDVEEAISSDFNYPCHALVDVVVNPDEPPMPAKVTYEQAKGFAESFLRGNHGERRSRPRSSGTKLDQLRI